MFNLEAEISLLGSIAIDNDSICEVIDFINPDDFYDVRNKIIYTAMKELYENDVHIEAVTLHDKVGTTIQLTYISQIIASTCTAVNIKNYGNIIKEKSKLRQLDLLLKNAVQNCGSEKTESNHIITELQNSLISLQDTSLKNDGRLEECLLDYLNKLQLRECKDNKIEGISMGYKALDNVTGGFIPKDYIILAGRPSMGKSALAVNLALKASLKENAKVAFFNLEMSIYQIIDRSISIISGINMKKIRNASLEADEWARIMKSCSTMNNNNLRIFDDILSLNKIKNQCKSLKLKNGLDIVFIDYIQMINAEEKHENRNLDVAAISRSLKSMAKELDITVIALSQLSRACEARAEHRPLLSDLRDSGSIEQDADIVMLLYRDAYYNAESQASDILECIIAKNRNGEVGTVNLKWNPKCQKVFTS